MNTQEQVLLKNHDLKNYMSAAYSYLDLLTHENPNLCGNEHIVSTMNILNCSVEKSKEIHALFRDLLKSSQPAGFERVQIQTLLMHEAVQSYERLRGIYALDVVENYELIDEPKFGLIHIAETKQAEENIFSNAFKAHATRVAVRHEMKEMFLVSTYADNGDGMTQDEIDIFMMAIYGDGISCGIGSRNIMRCAVNHKSPLTVTSGKGKGTTIRIVTPYMD